MMICNICGTGGAAITCKNELEKINEAHLEMVATQLRQVMISGSSSSKVPGMDWSKRNGKLEISHSVDDFNDQELLESSSFIVVHGAGQLLMVKFWLWKDFF